MAEAGVGTTPGVALKEVGALGLVGVSGVGVASGAATTGASTGKLPVLAGSGVGATEVGIDANDSVGMVGSVGASGAGVSAGVVSCEVLGAEDEGMPGEGAGVVELSSLPIGGRVVALGIGTGVAESLPIVGGVCGWSGVIMSSCIYFSPVITE